jgi:hypothetical protein
MGGNLGTIQAGSGPGGSGSGTVVVNPILNVVNFENPVVVGTPFYVTYFAPWWSSVPVDYHFYYGPKFNYDYQWYYYRHILFPNQYVVFVDEPVDVSTYYYFYDGLYYVYVGG